MQQYLRYLWAWHIKTRFLRWAERLTRWVAWHLPKSLIMWCYVRVGAHATSGPYGNTAVSELGMTEALKRWEGA